MTDVTNTVELVPVDQAVVLTATSKSEENKDQAVGVAVQTEADLKDGPAQ